MKGSISVSLAAFIAVACAAEPSPPPATPSPPPGPVRVEGKAVIRQEVGRPGAELSLENGAVLSIPPGALEGPTEVIFGIAESSPALSTADRQTVGPMLVVEPPLSSNSGGTFRVSCPLHALPSGFEREDLALAVEQPRAEQRALHMGGTQTLWQNLPAQWDGKRISATLPWLPGYRLAFVVAR
ncbi:MAG: hypothetical protein KC416_03900 [Myxococcales bacterium]|nr:hypothetical protein [Myxococcales bacterium]